MTGGGPPAGTAEALEGGGDPGRGPRWRAWTVYAVLAAAAVYVLVRNLYSPNDFANFVPFGQAALEGLNPYDPAVVAAFRKGHLWSTWPPAFAPVAALLAVLDRGLGTPVAIFLWHAANLAGLGLILAFCARWLYGRRLSLRPVPDALPLYSLAALAGLLIPLRLVLSNFEHSQSNLLSLGLAVAGFWLLRGGRRWWGGMSLGMATVFKATPLLLLPYLAWRGRWRDLGASAAGCAVAWLALPALLVGPGEVGEWYRGWTDFVGGLDLPLSQTNQSLQGTVSRLLAGLEPGRAGAEGLHASGAGPLGAHGAAPVVGVLAGSLGLAGALAFGRPGQGVGPRREALELGVVFTAMGLFSPIGWKFHFVGLVPLSAALWARTRMAARWRGGGGGPGGHGGGLGGHGGAGRPGPGGAEGGAPESRVDATLVALAAATLAINGTATGVVGGRAADVLEHFGVVTWPALALVMAGLWLLWRDREEEAAAGPVEGVVGSAESAA